VIDDYKKKLQMYLRFLKSPDRLTHAELRRVQGLLPSTVTLAVGSYAEKNGTNATNSETTTSSETTSSSSSSDWLEAVSKAWEKRRIFEMIADDINKRTLADLYNAKSSNVIKPWTRFKVDVPQTLKIAKKIRAVLQHAGQAVRDFFANKNIDTETTESHTTDNANLNPEIDSDLQSDSDLLRVLSLGQDPDNNSRLVSATLNSSTNSNLRKFTEAILGLKKVHAALKAVPDDPDLAKLQLQYWRLVVPLIDAHTSAEYSKALFETKKGQEHFSAKVLSLLTQ